VTTAVPPDPGLAGEPANVATRAAGFVVDAVLVTTLFAVAGAVVEWLVGVFLGHEVRARDAGPLSGVVMAVWAFVYFAYPLAVAGRTVGMAVLGLRVVRASDGSDLGPGAVALRVVALPLSFLLAGLGFLLIPLRRDHRALHDLIAGSAVVYAWRARGAHLAVLMRPSPPRSG
jgi:uncharacterized RDD family membrane protein YckC